MWNWWHQRLVSIKGAGQLKEERSTKEHDCFRTLHGCTWKRKEELSCCVCNNFCSFISSLHAYVWLIAQKFCFTLYMKSWPTALQTLVINVLTCLYVSGFSGVPIGHFIRGRGHWGLLSNITNWQGRVQW